MNADRERGPWLFAALLVVVVFTAVTASRLHRSVYVDEPWVARTIRAGWYEPHGNSAPPLFFFAAVVAGRLFHETDAALRLPALIFGVLLASSPVLFFPLVKKWISRGAALVAVVLLGFSSPILFYAARIKQYTAEALVAITLLSLGLWLAAEPSSKRRLGVFAIVSVLAVLVSTTAAFVFGGAVLALFASGVVPRGEARRKFLGRFLVVALAVAAAFLAAYFGYLKPGAGIREKMGQDITAYFEGAGTPEFFDGSIAFVVTRTRHWIGHFFNLTRLLVPVLLVVIVAWVVREIRQDRERVRLRLILGLALFPILLALAASGFHVYPYGEVRLMTFLFPGVAILAAMAITDTIPRARAGRALWAAAACGFLFVFFRNGVVDESYAHTYMGVYDLSAEFRTLEAWSRPGDVIVASEDDLGPFRYEEPQLSNTRNLRAREIFDWGQAGESTRLWFLVPSSKQLSSPPQGWGFVFEEFSHGRLFGLVARVREGP